MFQKLILFPLLRRAEKLARVDVPTRSAILTKIFSLELILTCTCICSLMRPWSYQNLISVLTYFESNSKVLTAIEQPPGLNTTHGWFWFPAGQLLLVAFALNEPIASQYVEVELEPSVPAWQRPCCPSCMAFLLACILTFLGGSSVLSQKASLPFAFLLSF